MLRLTVVLLALITSPAFGRSQTWLKAQNGTEITITFDKDEIVVVGDSRELRAVRPTIRVKNAQWTHDSGGKSIQAVLLGFCRWNGEPQERTILSEVLDLPYTHLQDLSGFGYEAQTSLDFRISYKLKSGGAETCRQEVAVVVDDVWLVDPVSGRHNFRFDMVAAPAE